MGAPQGPHGMGRARGPQYTRTRPLAFFPKTTPLEHAPHGKAVPLPWQSTLLNTVTKTLQQQIPIGAARPQGCSSPTSHPSCSRVSSTRAEWVPASPWLPPGSPTKVPFRAGGEVPRAASAARCCPNELLPVEGPSRPARCKSPADKGSRLARNTGSSLQPWPQDGPRLQDRQMDRWTSGSRACPLPQAALSEGLPQEIDTVGGSSDAKMMPIPVQPLLQSQLGSAQAHFPASSF